MKLYVIVLLAVTGIVLADDETTPTLCTVTLDQDEEMHTKMATMALNCLATRIPIDRKLKAVASLEEHKTLFKENYCDKRQQIRECLTSVADSSEVCQGETHHKFLSLFRELLENGLDGGCVEDGEILAATYMSYHYTGTKLYEDDHFHYCVHSAVTRLSHLMAKDFEPHSRFFILYREMIITKECFDDIKDGDVTLMKKIASILDDVSNKMKCMHPREEIPVLCKAIDVNLPDVPRICPIMVEDETKHSMKDDLLTGMSWCLTSTFLNEDGLRTINTLERAWKFVVHNCEAREEIGRCLSEVTTLSSVCLDDVQHMAVKLVDDVLQHALDALCIVDGGHAGGYVLFKVLTKTDATLRHNDITECMDTAHKAVHEEPHTHVEAANFLNLHHELNAFKRCLVDALRGDNRAVFDAHLFLSSVERKMKCLHPELGTMVLCDSLETIPTTELAVCPFVGTHQNEPPKYDRLIDMAILCLKTSEMELDPVKKFTTLTQFQEFFKTFCPKRHDVKHCYDDIKSFSKVCMDLANHNMLTLYVDLFGNILEYGCQHDGEMFATVLNGLFVEDNDLRETCVNAIANPQDKRDPSTMTVAESSMFHHGLLVTMNECILGGASDASTFKTAYATLANELLKDFKCIHPDDGTLVPCETLVHN